MSAAESSQMSRPEGEIPVDPVPPSVPAVVPEEKRTNLTGRWSPLLTQPVAAVVLWNDMLPAGHPGKMPRYIYEGLVRANRILSLPPSIGSAAV